MQGSSFHNRRLAWCIAWSLGFLAALPSSESAATSCVIAETAHLRDPVVTVLSGPGSAAEEQARLAGLEFAYVDATPQLTMGQTTFDLEAGL